MKKVIVMTIAALCVAVVAQAASVDADIGIASKYVWRGMLLDEQPVVQGGVTVTHDKGFYANVWGNYSMSEDYAQDYFGGADGLNEVDYTLGFAGTVDIIDYDVGYIYYTFPGTTFDSTSEFYLGLALNNLVVTPSVYVYYDVDEANGFYAVADLNYGKDLSESLSMEVGASLAWASANFNNFYLGNNSSALADASLYTGLSYALTESLSLSGSLAYTFFPDGSQAGAADATYGDEQDNLFGSINLSYSF